VSKPVRMLKTVKNAKKGRIDHPETLFPLFPPLWAFPKRGSNPFTFYPSQSPLLARPT
jgi:hypothetical protein